MKKFKFGGQWYLFLSQKCQNEQYGIPVVYTPETNFKKMLILEKLNENHIIIAYACTSPSYTKFRPVYVNPQMCHVKLIALGIN